MRLGSPLGRPKVEGLRPRRMGLGEWLRTYWVVPVAVALGTGMVTLVLVLNNAKTIVH